MTPNFMLSQNIYVFNTFLLTSDEWMFKKWMKILKNKPRVKNIHSLKIMLYISYDAEFYAESEYICTQYIIVKLTIINGPKVIGIFIRKS